MKKTSKKEQDFKKLQKKWYKKLKDEGFKDIEVSNEFEKLDTVLKGSKDQSLFNLNTFDAKRAYYYYAEQFLNYHEFDNESDRQMWELHASGYFHKEIAEKLGCSKSTVYNFARSIFPDFRVFIDSQVDEMNDEVDSLIKTYLSK